MLRALRWFSALAAVAIATGAANAQSSYITGSVTDASNGSPVAEALVQVRTGAGVAVAQARSDAGGRFRINAVPVGSYTVTARAIGFAEAGQTGVQVVDGAPTILSFDLAPTATVLNPVVTSVQGVEQKATEAPASVHVVMQEQINATPAITVIDHLTGVPGIDIVKGGLLQSNVVARGFNNIFSGSVLTLTDHRFAFVPSLRVNVPYLSPSTNEDIERIEVVLGPGSALYGPNAASGVIHVISRSPFDSPGTTITLDAGSRSVMRTALRHAGTVGTRFGYKLSGEYFKGDDWESVDSAELKLQSPPGTPKPVFRSFDVEKYGGEARVDFRPRPGMEFIGTYGRAQAVDAIEPTGLGAAQVQDWVFNSYQLRGAWNRLFAQVFLNKSDAGDTFLLRNRNNADSGKIVDKSSQLVFQAQHGTSLGARQDFIYGIDVQNTNPQTEGTINGRREDDDEISEFGGYLHSTTQLMTNLQLVAALRYDTHSRLDDPVWSPRAAITWQPTEDQGFRVTYNRAFSTPSSNNMFLDLAVASIPIPTTPGYTIRTLGTPQDGFQFNRSCTGGVGSGLCMRSPFVLTSPFMPANAGGIWKTVALPVALANGLQAQLAASIGAANAQNVVNALNAAAAPTTVGTQLRVLNPTNGTFVNVGPEYAIDLTAIEPTITNTYEVGYRGTIMDRLSLTVDVYQQRRENFVGPLIVETPNVFLDSLSLAGYITTVLTGAGFGAASGPIAASIAAGTAGTPGTTSAAIRGIPLGVVNLNHPLNNPTDIVLAYRNFGDVDLWGSDVGASFAVNDTWTVGGTYSYSSKDFFPAAAGGHDIALNAPANKYSVMVGYRNRSGLSAEIRNRWVAGFPANSGVYIGDVPAYTLLDANISLRPALFNGKAMISVGATNLLEDEHQEFIGGATIGRHIMTRLQYTF